MIKKYFILAVSIAGFALAVNFVTAAVSYNGFTFDQKVTTSQGKDYFVDVIAGPNIVQMANGRYDLEAALGFYGVTNPNDDGYFTSEIDEKTYVKVKKKGSTNYLHQLGVDLTGGVNVPGEPGRIEYYYMRTSTLGNYVEPGNYTVDAIWLGNVVGTYDVCLPTFTSASGNSIGNVTCSTPSVVPANTPSVSASGSATANATTTVNASSTSIDSLDNTPAPDTQIGQVVGPYTGKYTYLLIGQPTVTCNTQAQTCTFTKQIRGSVTGNVALYVRFFPKENFDNGGTKQFVATPYGYSEKVYAAKTYTAKVTIPMSYLKTQMDAMQAPDKKYYIEFINAMDYNFASNDKMYDFGTVIPATPVSNAVITYSLTSLLAPAKSVTIKGTVASSEEAMETFDLYVWPVGGQPVKVQTSQPIFVTPQGSLIEFTVANLQATTSYNYKIVKTGTTVDVYENMFSTGIPTDQAAAFVTTDGLCGSATSTPMISAPTTNLCNAGTSGGVSGSGPWTWTCLGENGGSDQSCSVDSLANAGGAACGPAGLTDLEEAPSGTSLCSGGTASTVTTTADGWSWTCVSNSNDQKPCSTKKKVAGSEGDDADNSNKSNTFLQNPFKNLDTFPKIIKAVVNNIVLPIAVPFVAVMLIYSGFLFVVARKDGNTYNLAKAKQTLLYTLIGATLILGSFVIANALQGTLNSIVGTRYQNNHETLV